MNEPFKRCFDEINYPIQWLKHTKPAFLKAGFVIQACGPVHTASQREVQI
jgi:hypothetical protein